MPSLIRPLIATAALALASVAFAQSQPAGFVDFGSFPDVDHSKQFVDIEVDGSLLKLAALFAGKEDPEVARLLSNLDRVRVNVIGLSDATRQSITERVEAVRSQLVEQGWKRVVTVREAAGDNVGIYLKQGANDVIQGVVVTVIGASDEAVLVNVVGEVQLEQIAKLGQHLDLAPLRELNLAAR